MFHRRVDLTLFQQHPPQYQLGESMMMIVLTQPRNRHLAGHLGPGRIGQMTNIGQVEQGDAGGSAPPRFCREVTFVNTASSNGQIDDGPPQFKGQLCFATIAQAQGFLDNAP